MSAVQVKNSDSLEILFKPTRLGGVDLRNRVAMAPMTRAMSPGGVPGENVAGYYRRRAEAASASSLLRARSSLIPAQDTMKTPPASTAMTLLRDGGELLTRCTTQEPGSSCNSGTWGSSASRGSTAWGFSMTMVPERRPLQPFRHHRRERSTSRTGRATGDPRRNSRRDRGLWRGSAHRKGAGL